ncbi:unnamed protein product [Porites evermanni]|uniref:Arrestin-like N-terminal domain-containing protein n=1 Tax=Porites evermanni TaxID=104178 RepID=A0ABN8SIF6_9CNID|nr:unnamed protein product [Porites evermanni]
MQVYPPKPEDEVPLTRLQERLRKKLGTNAYPFKFELPRGSPSSVTLQPAPGDTGKPCGVDYELKTYISESPEEKPHKRNTVRLAIRKITYAPERPLPQPRAETDKEFMLSLHKLHIEASLDKEVNRSIGLFIVESAFSLSSYCCTFCKFQYDSLQTSACFQLHNTNVQWPL